VKISTSNNDQLMAMAAMRYCLGRRSYIVGACLEWLRDVWDQLQPNTQQVMVRDIVEMLITTTANTPLDCDERGWEAFAEWAYPQLSEDQIQWLRGNVAWHHKPWPLKVGGPEDPACIETANLPQCGK